MVMQLINNPADREFRFLQADLLIEEEHMEEADEILQQLAMDEEYELDTLLDIILNYVDVNQERIRQEVDRLPVCPFRHANPAGNQPTSSRRAVRLLQYFQQTGLGYPLPEHDPERVPLFRSALE